MAGQVKTLTPSKSHGGNGHEPDAVIQTIISRHRELTALVRKTGGVPHNLTDLGNGERFVQAVFGVQGKISAMVSAFVVAFVAAVVCSLLFPDEASVQAPAPRGAAGGRQSPAV